MKLFSFGITIKDPCLQVVLKIIEDAQKRINAIDKETNRAMHAGYVSRGQEEADQMIVSGSGEEITKVIRETGETLEGYARSMKLHSTTTVNSKGGRTVNL